MACDGLRFQLMPAVFFHWFLAAYVTYEGAGVILENAGEESAFVPGALTACLAPHSSSHALSRFILLLCAIMLTLSLLLLLLCCNAEAAKEGDDETANPRYTPREAMGR